MTSWKDAVIVFNSQGEILGFNNKANKLLIEGNDSFRPVKLTQIFPDLMHITDDGDDMKFNFPTEWAGVYVSSRYGVMQLKIFISSPFDVKWDFLVAKIVPA